MAEVFQVLESKTICIIASVYRKDTAICKGHVVFMMQKRVMCDLLEPSQLQLKQWGKAKANGNVVYVTYPCFSAMMPKLIWVSLYDLH